MSENGDKKFFHLGHAVMDCFRRHPDEICQIDAGTGGLETNASVLSRSTRLAKSLTALGFVPGDIVAVGGKNHLDIRIPYYAALFNGMTLVGVDPLFKIDEIKYVFKLTSPKLAFCDVKDYDVFVQAARDLGLETKVFSFGTGPGSMKALVEDASDVKEDEFEFPEFDTGRVYIWLISTSGSTGTVKFAAFTYDSLLKSAMQFVNKIVGRTNTAYRPALNLSPIQWISGIVNGTIMPLANQTILQTSAPMSVEHVIDIINKYKPIKVVTAPTTATNILNHEKPCDLTCFDLIILGGSPVTDDLVIRLRSKIREGAKAVQMHGQTETMGPVLVPGPDSPPVSCGKPMASHEVQLVDPDTGRVITESNVPGELCIKGNMFSVYYNNPEATAESFTKDGWFKSGDLMYRDERGEYYYVSRIKTLIKYQNYHVVPGELESVIRSHSAVAEVTVIGVPHPVDGEHPIACVVKKQGCDVTAQEIKELVANKLSEKKQLRGGVLFLTEFPLTSTAKVNLSQLRTIVKNNKHIYL